MKIQNLCGLEVLDSRGKPTVACLMEADGLSVFSMVPSGASTGAKEALELRDNDNNRYNGNGVQKAVSNINSIIAPAILNSTWESQREFDQFLLHLDGTPNKSKLGANAILATSLAFCKLQAKLSKKNIWQLFSDEPRIPVPLINVINGGVHADNSLDFQEFMIVPHGFRSFSEALRAGVEIFSALKGILKSDGMSVNVGDEGGFAPNYSSPFEVLDVLMKAVEKAGYETGHQVSLALDIAASELFENNQYKLFKSNGEVLKTSQFIELIEKILKSYPVISIEDPFAEDDTESWHIFNQKFCKKAYIIGDDLLCTNKELISKAIERKLINGVLIKPNQIGTLTETLEAIELAKRNNCIIAVSHRSGETEDTFLADLAVGTGAQFIKTGSVCRGERTCKYNRLLVIEKFSEAKFQSLSLDT
ncbi:MAG: phosphopyruvate hydratase [Deltaproteobacteria bacterium]|nr:phosphopyruvate hydratase [Deltaproteobacteria bacterium]